MMLNRSESAMQQLSAVEGRRWLLLIIVSSALLCLPWLGRPFYTRGEAREALVPQAMIQSGNWTLPAVYDGNVPSKPPFSHWLMALASWPTGSVSEWSTRLPAALTFMALNVAVFLVFSARLGSVGVAASVIFLLSLEWLRAGVSTRVDTVFSGLLVGALLAFFQWWERGCRSFPWLLSLLVGCAALTKGPVAFVLSAGVAGSFILLETGSVLTAIRRTLLFILPALLLPVLWYLAAYVSNGDRFMEKVWYENVQRFMGTQEDEPHRHSMFYLLAWIVIGLLPWPLLLGRGNFVKFGAEKIRAWYRNAPSLVRYSMVASVVIVGFFCIPKGKRGVYILPAFPFLALLFSVWLNGRRPVLESLSRGSRIFGVVGLVLAALLLVVLPFGASLTSLLHAPFGSDLLLEELRHSKLLYVLIIAIAAFGACCFRTKAIGAGGDRTVPIAVICAVCTAALIQGPIVDAVARTVTERSFAEEIAPRVPAEAVLHSWGHEFYGMSFYLRRPFGNYRGESGGMVVLQVRDLERFRAEYSERFEIIELQRSSSPIQSLDVRTVLVEVVPR